MFARFLENILGTLLQYSKKFGPQLPNKYILIFLDNIFFKLLLSNLSKQSFYKI